MRNGHPPTGFQASHPAPANCILCGERASYRSVFVPSDPRALGVGTPPAGKMRVCFYGLCARCFPPGRKAMRRIERRMITAWREQHGQPEPTDRPGEGGAA